MAEEFKQILADLPRCKDAVEDILEMLLANLVMLGEIPAPTFGEERRQQLLQQRFSECGLQNCSTDEVGNAVGLIPATEPVEEEPRNILLVAHSDTVFPANVDHTITLHDDRAIGPAVADNSLGVAVVATIPTILERLGIRLKSNLILMGASRSLGRGNLEGLRFFLNNNPLPICAGVCIEGVPLGRISYTSIGMVRGEIWCRVPEEYDWTRFGTTSAIITLNEVINRLIEIKLPRRPRTNIFLGSIEGGTSFDTSPTSAVLRFEIRSESREMVREVCQQIEDIVAEVGSRPGADVTLDIFARRRPGGISFRHPLVRNARRILRALKVAPRASPSTSELAAFIDRKIPAITVGVTTGEHIHEQDESIELGLLPAGVAQVIGILLAIDGGFCDED